MLKAIDSIFKRQVLTNENERQSTLRPIIVGKFSEIQYLELRTGCTEGRDTV